jgi:hypothetical protein
MTTSWIIINIALGILLTVIVAGPAVLIPVVLHSRDMAAGTWRRRGRATHSGRRSG